MFSLDNQNWRSGKHIAHSVQAIKLSIKDSSQYGTLKTNDVVALGDKTFDRDMSKFMASGSG